ncbi:MAG: asparaginase domain-containing protein [Candidatus Geothermarchaeales archaeon]
MKIVFVQTGGTIDKEYPRVRRGCAFEVGEPSVERILGRVNPRFEFEIMSVLRKDSLEIDEEDREKIYEACAEAASDKVVVTHGTDTMIETAKKLSGIKTKTIILTGSMKPERFYESDAAFNVGTAVGSINVLERGTYVAMNGRVYPWDRVRWDPETGAFIEE